jgi:hypothetical protein
MTENGEMIKMDNYNDEIRFKCNPPSEITNYLLPESTLNGTLDDPPIDYT